MLGSVRGEGGREGEGRGRGLLDSKGCEQLGGWWSETDHTEPCRHIYY